MGYRGDFMKKLRFRFIRTTIIGGLLFLVPIVILAILAAKAQQLSSIVVRPLADLVPVKTVAGVALARLLAFAAIVVFCFLAGLFAKTILAKRMIAWLELNLLSIIPGYHWIKDLGQDLTGFAKTDTHEPVLAWIEEAWQIAFVVERIDEEHVAVYVPGAPSPLSGSLFFMPKDRVKPLEIPAKEALKCVRGLAVGSGTLLKGKL
jgi:uncharacterized membrane protein